MPIRWAAHVNLLFSASSIYLSVRSCSLTRMHGRLRARLREKTISVPLIEAAFFA